MTVLTVNKLTASVGAEVTGVDPDRLAGDDLWRGDPRGARGQRGTGVPRPRSRSRGAGGVLPAARRDRPLVGRPPSGPGHLPGDTGPVEERGAAYLGRRSTGTSTAARRWTTNARRGRRCCRPSGRRDRRRDRVRQHLRRLRRVRRRGEGAVRRRCGWSTRSRRRSGASTRTAPRRWPGGVRAHPRASAGVDAPRRTQASCSARRPTMSSAWTSTRAGHCSPTCSSGRPAGAGLQPPWTVGDTVIWDNRGVLHRAEPYDPDSPREMLRTTVLGDEPIQ